MKPDYIRVWKCESCGEYDLDSFAGILYCVHCGEKMIAKTYMEVEK